MRLRFFILFIFSLSFFYRSSAQEKTELTQSRILFLLDESSSMLQTWSNGRPKHKIANELIERLMDSVNAVNSQVQFSLRVFGNQHTVPEHDCTDTKNEVPFSPDNRTQMSFRLDDLRPLGVTAIAYSLSEAAEHDLVDETHNAYSIILITDGGESCNGDICGVMEKLVRNKVFFKPYVLSLEDAPELKSEYACLGNYLPVTKTGDIAKAVNTIVEAFRPMLKISKAEYKKIQVIAASAPSALKVSLPVVKPDKPEPVPVIAVPKIDKPKPDTVAAPKTSHIVVGEMPKRAAPVKMKKIANGKTVLMFVSKPSLKALPTVALPTPDIKVSVEEITIPHPGPIVMKPAVVGKMKKRPLSGFVFTTLSTVVAVPPVINTELPFVRPAPIKMARVKMPVYTKPVIKKTTPASMVKMAEPIVAITVSEKDITPVRPPSFKVQSIAVTGLKKFNTNAPVTPLKKVKVIVPVIKMEEPEPVAVEPIIPTPPPAPKVVHKPAKIVPKRKPGTFRMHLLYVNTFLDSDLKTMKVPPLPEFKFTPPPVAPTPAPPTAVKPKPGKPTPAPAETTKTGEYKVEHEDANETTLQVYITNGKGKFYSTTPRVVLFDPTNKKEIKRFFRTVDDAGNPDVIDNLPAGKYDLTVVGRDDLLAHVDMQANKHNKVFIKVKPFSMIFTYDGAPNRPVKEFTATVIQRNTTNGKVTEQRCSEKLEYEPGNYHIVINTFPEEVHNIDVDVMGPGGIVIAQPGFVKFTSNVATDRVALYKELGDKFVQFAVLNLADPALQHLMIQPGKYQAHYSNGLTKFSTSDRVLSFIIKSTQETEVVLTK